MKNRRLFPVLERRLSEVPALALLGPRQAGKTTLARARAAGQADDALYLDLESEQDRAKLAEPELYLVDHLDRPRLRGGFPESFLAASDARSLRWRQDFIRSYLERDIPQFGPRIPAERLRRFWTMLAHHQGGMLNVAQLARNLGVDAKTAAAYIDLLADLLLLRRLPSWHANVGKRLVKSPRVYVRDSGLVHALLGLGDKEAVVSHPVVGASWEGFVVYPGGEAYPVGQDVLAIPLLELARCSPRLGHDRRSSAYPIEPDRARKDSGMSHVVAEGGPGAGEGDRGTARSESSGGRPDSGRVSHDLRPDVCCGAA